jgi:hypothetical protein
MISTRLLLAAAVMTPLAAVPASTQSVSPVNFARGASSTTIEGSIRGDQYIDYRIAVRAGQMLRVNMTTVRGSPYFNVMEPGSSDVAIFVGSTSGADFEARTRMAGAYTVRVYQMRASGRRGEVAAYRLRMAAGGGGGGAGAHPDAPAHHPADALVRGTPYHAVANVRCRVDASLRWGQCKAGVIRRPGSASLHLDTLDGGERNIAYRDGRAVSSDARLPIRVVRRGDTSVISIGRFEVYEIPDALPNGG